MKIKQLFISDEEFWSVGVGPVAKIIKSVMSDWFEVHFADSSVLVVNPRHVQSYLLSDD